MSHDIVIRGGPVVDGTGAAPCTGDVAVDGGPHRRGRRRRRRPADATIDADGRARHPRLRRHPHALRRPGDLGRRCSTPSSWHGVTTVVMGNCGVGFAPVRPSDHEWLIELMEGVEDIPGTALHEGIDVGVGELPRVPRRARRAAHRDSTSPRSCRTARCALT